MKSLFIGSVDFSEKALKKLIEIGVKIEGIITKNESSFNSDYKDLSKTAVKNNIPYLYTNDINTSQVKSWIIKKNPEIIFCFGWSQLIKKEILNIPSKGIVGYHPAKIPENRGRHPLIWAILLGLRETASTFFIMDEGADSGNIISQRPFRIFYEDYAQDVYNRMTKTAIAQMEEFIPNLLSGDLEVKPQVLSTGNIWRKRGIEDGKIDFRMSSINIYNLVRALSKPYVGAHILYDNKEIKIWKTVPENFETINIEPGKVLEINGSKIKVKTGDSAIWLIDHEFNLLPKINSYL